MTIEKSRQDSTLILKLDGWLDMYGKRRLPAMQVLLTHKAEYDAERAA